ncbi:MAG: hypothetical protein WC827_04030 [Candidatus Paceibacterota bacterium]|jgi:hypothetical protein
MTENSKLGTAADVTADLQKKVAEVARTKEPKVKLTDLIIKLINDATYLPAEGKTTLLAEIDKIVNKVTTAKPSIKLEIRELLIAAGEKGISRDELYTALAAKHPEVSPMNLALSIYPVMQPVNYVHGGKLGWNVKVAVGGNYVWVIK